MESSAAVAQNTETVSLDLIRDGSAGLLRMISQMIDEQCAQTYNDLYECLPIYDRGLFVFREVLVRMGIEAGVDAYSRQVQYSKKGESAYIRGQNEWLYTLSFLGQTWFNGLRIQKKSTEGLLTPWTMKIDDATWKPARASKGFAFKSVSPWVNLNDRKLIVFDAHFFSFIKPQKAYWDDFIDRVESGVQGAFISAGTTAALPTNAPRVRL